MVWSAGTLSLSALLVNDPVDPLYEGTGGVNYLKPGLLKLSVDFLGHTVRADDDRTVIDAL